MKKYDNKNTIHHNIQDEFRAESRGEFIALNSLMTKNERMIINDIFPSSKNLEKTQQSKHK